MRRLILGLAAAAALAGPMAAAGDAQAQTWDRQGRGDHRDWSRDNDRGSRSGFDNGRERREWSTWESSRYNGYYYYNRWSYGPPPPAYYSNPNYRPGYSSWRRGSVLPPYYRGYVVNDYYRYHLRPPPRGYAWYQAGDDYLLVAIASGLIFEIIADN